MSDDSSKRKRDEAQAASSAPSTPASSWSSRVSQAIAPTNSLVTPLLNDMYQLTMAYAYWKANRHTDHAVFELFFRKCPFDGEFTIFAGLDEVLKHLHAFKFTASDIKYLRSLMPTCDEGFFDYLSSMNCKDIKLYALQEGTLAFPRIPRPAWLVSDESEEDP